MSDDRVSADLESRRRPGAVVKRLGGIRALAARLAGDGLPQPARALLDDAFSATAYERFMKVRRRRGEIGEMFARHDASDWDRAIETLIPHVAPSARAACRLMEYRPYQEGLTRKPFRSPRSAATLADVRGRWLLETTLLVGEYDADIRWIAERAAHIAGWNGGTDIGWLLAGAMETGGREADEIFEILKASALGEHETGRMGRHITQAFMSSRRPDAWDFVERLLLSAQRQEGVRQAILEAVDESHPEAFRRMLRLVVEEDLARFSSVVRAADTWFGFLWDGSSGVAIDSILRRVLLFLDDPSARTAALAEHDAETVYLALWCIAFEDVDAAIPPAVQLLESPSEELRFVATHFLVQTTWSTAIPPLAAMLADPSLQVAARALDLFGTDATEHVDGRHVVAHLEQLIARVPRRSVMLEPLVWPWFRRKLEKPTIASAMAANAKSVEPERLIPHVPDMTPFQREAFVRDIAGLPARWSHDRERRRVTLSATQRSLLLELLGDSSADVRAAAFEAMRDLPLKQDEVDRLIDLLDRKPGDLRSGALARLGGLGDSELMTVADRLLADASEPRRLAGLELLRDAHEAHRSSAEIGARIQRFVAERVSPSEPERVHVDAILGARQEVASRDDALGLVHPSALRVWPQPAARRIEVETQPARASLESLARLILEHQGTEVGTASGETKLLVESAGWGFGPRRRDPDAVAPEAVVPLADVWRGWSEQRPAALRDADGLELVRALMAREHWPWKLASVQQVMGIGQWSAGTRFLTGILEWCIVWDPPAGVLEFLLDGLESSLAAMTESDYRELREDRAQRGVIHLGSWWGERKRPAYHDKLSRADEWLKRVRWWRDLFPGLATAPLAERLFGILCAVEESSAGADVLPIVLEDFLSAYRHGIVGEYDFIDLLVGRWTGGGRRGILREVSTRKAPKGLVAHPELIEIVDRCRRRVVEVETKRGDRVTAASPLAMELRWTGGLDTVRQALPALGKSHFARSFGWSFTGASRQHTLSHLVLRSVPREEDTLDAFAAWVREAKVKELRLVELAVYAPQWAAHVNHVLGWPGLESAVWWIQAHTKDDRSWDLQELKEIWAAEVSERTPLSPADLTEGAVDVAWFTAAFGELGAERWKVLDTAARYAASSGGHTRAQLFARAMAGLVSREELLERIDRSRHQDSVRALGLLPLAPGEPGAADLLARYERLQAFRRESRKFGSQRQASEKRAVEIGMANLARTAGHRDPQRLQWAMERAAVADLANGPLVLTRGDVTLTLSLDADGVPSLATTRNGKALKSLPASLKKDADVAELRERLTELKRQRSRVRDALEDAMCRGDRFTTGELQVLLTHPLLAPALSRLVFVGEDVAGYPAEGGRVLRDHAGGQHVLGTGEEVRLAHPHDLFARGDWSAWQRECFRAERIQPFKQLFRELYPLTAAERGTERTTRYAGHQVNPRQALALLGGRGWVARPDEGVGRTFHEQGLTARLEFEEGFYTPADVEGLTLDAVIFTRKGEWTPLPLSEIPARVFSEAMRDLDLVVSVAHQGGVDPEATASTVEMRAALVAETCELLGLGNVELKPRHAVITGALGTYAVHLGSAGVTLMPGTALPIVAVHAQHRGRLFLPFADDDPRTAEVLSKVLLLARDREIRDPNILEWIRAGSGGVTA